MPTAKISGHPIFKGRPFGVKKNSSKGLKCHFKKLVTQTLLGFSGVSKDHPLKDT